MSQTKALIQILHLEDNPRDAELVQDLLAADGLDCVLRQAKGRSDFEAALLEGAFDLVLTDFNVADYDGIAALQAARARDSAVPVLMISGSIGEDAAIRCLQLGATDYLLKDRLDRLPSAVRRALKEADKEKERRRAEEALRASEERFALVAQATSDAIWDWNLGTGQFWWGGHFQELFGEPADVAADQVPPWSNRVHPSDLTRVRNKLVAAIEGRGSGWSDEYRFRRYTGAYAIVVNRGFIVRDAHGRPLRMVGGMTDVTDRKLAEERFAAMFHSSPVATIFGTFDGRILDGNAQAFDLFGYPPEEIIGRTSVELQLWANPDDRTRALGLLMQGKTLRNLEAAFRRKSGELRYTLLSVELLQLAGEPVLLAMLVDITDRKALETQLHRMQRVESVGQLASGIAHDMNNILAPVMMSVPLLRMGLPDEEAAPILASIEACAQRGAALVRQLLIFGRGVEGERRPIKLAAVVADVTKIAEQTFSRKINIRVNVASDTWLVHGDPTQLHQVMLNLCVNARDAMPLGGDLKVTTENVEIDEAYANSHRDARAGKYVRLRVSDSGTGIPAEIVDRIFDPFFTTKEAGKGTGIGLSTVLGIVKSHGGFIRLESAVGQGTTFEVFLPASPDSGAGASSEEDLAATPQGRGELILVVDDEENIRAVLRDTLIRRGYRVVTAPNGVEATVVFASNPGVRLVITDIDMPMMDGIGLARVLRQSNPSLSFVISTGAGGRSGAARRRKELEALGIRTVLTKPYAPEKLLRAIHEVLSGRR